MAASGSYEFLRQERVIFGRPMAEAVLEEADRHGAGRLFIVASKTLSRTTPVIEDLRAAMNKRFAGLFDACVEHTPRASVIAATDAARAADPDMIVTVGGGTAIDTVKVLQICLAQNVRTPEGLDDYHVTIGADGKPHVPIVAPSPARQIIVPTTLSGAEFSSLAGCTDPRRQVKDAYTAPDICGISVILDAAVTVHTPEWLWLSTGVRAIDHAVEAICSSASQPFTDGLGLHALRIFAGSLRRNKAAPSDLSARLQSQQAVWLAGSSINRVPYGASHGIGHALGAVAGVSHGYTSCILLPAVLRYNKPVNADKQALVADALGAPGEDAADVVAALIADLGMPTRLRDVDVSREQFSQVAQSAQNNLFVRQNPRPITGPKDIEEILEMAW